MQALSIPQWTLRCAISRVMDLAVMKATRFEFRYRWWLIFSIFFLAFSAYFVDHVNSAEAIVHWRATHLGITVANTLSASFLHSAQRW